MPINFHVKLYIYFHKQNVQSEHMKSILKIVQSRTNAQQSKTPAGDGHTLHIHKKPWCNFFIFHVEDWYQELGVTNVSSYSM